MAPTLDPGVRERMNSPAAGENVNVLVKLASVDESTQAAVEDAATSISVEEVLKLNYVRISTAEDDLATLCDLPNVEKVEIEGKGEVMSSDFRTPSGPRP